MGNSMNARTILKTVLICFGIFIIFGIFIYYYVTSHYRFDTEQLQSVYITSKKLQAGAIINDSMVREIRIKESAVNSYMAKSIGEISGMKLLSDVEEGDYIRKYTLIPKEKWHTDDERITIIPMEVEERLANLVRKGSLIDIKVSIKGILEKPKLVLGKVTVIDIVDENGVALGESSLNRKAFCVFNLDRKFRDRLYFAMDTGKIKLELYNDNTQPAPEDYYEIPAAYLK